MPSIADARTVLVIGATSGLGRALARAIRDLPSKPTVIVSGRRKEKLEELGREERLIPEQLDISVQPEQLTKSVNTLLKKYADIDAVLIAAGIQRQIDVTKAESIDLTAVQAELYTNFVSVFALVSKCFIPHFQQLEKQGRPTFILPISSGLAAVPASWCPVYCASKAALHSFCLTTQNKLAQSKIHIIEIAPPLVESELHDFEGTTEALSKRWMPLDEYTKRTMNELLKLDGSGLVAVGWAKEMFDKFEVASSIA